MTDTPENPTKPRRLVLPVVIVVAVLSLLYYQLRTGDPQSLPSVLIGKPVPDFQLAALPGAPSPTGSPVPGFSSEDLKKGRVSLINVWASWCAPCQVEHPLITDLARQGIPVYGINYKGDTPAGAKRFLARLGNPYKAIGVDDTGRVSIDFGVYGVPETFVIDGAGRIAYRHAGPLTEEVIAQKLKPAMEKAAKAAPPQS
ncbi:DsbE family thiol:disulfide interchange protein [Rhodomicrobium sp.]|uniref:DsbE family thiol:disulfide interchange protein n=1 Tax=Rhodomicrobium sp. TaxID=2720632 RepID=UPI0039E286C6